MQNSTHNARIELALADLRDQKKPNVLATAKKFHLVESTLRRRWNGETMSKEAAISEYKQLLTCVQEEALIEQINRYTDRGIPPTVVMVRSFAEDILGRPIGKNWTGDFVKRYQDRLKSVYLRNIDNNRLQSEYALSYQQFYSLLTRGIEKYHITAENTYNWDEKGFLIGYGSRTKRVMTLEALKNERITHASQDGNREFISLLACVCADGTRLAPTLIYKGKSGALQDTWLDDWDQSKEEAYFASSNNGWTCDALGLEWLQKVFCPQTATKAGLRRRLLIVDGHSSHVNTKFIDYCDEMRIILLILPPHSTHRLQPLDVSLFAPLATFYTQQLQRQMSESLGITNMSKRDFWRTFWPVWQQAFTPQNIASGFEKTGIWPLNADVVISKITKPSAPEALEDPKGLKTPLDCFAVRRMQRQYKKKPCSPILAKIFRANERLAAQQSISKHVIVGLTNSLRNEKKKRRKGKRLNLLGQEESGAQLFSPGRVQAARDYQATKEEVELQKQQDIADKKAQAALNKLQQEADKKARQEETVRRRQMVAARKIQEAAEKQARKELKKKAKLDSGGQSRVQRASTGPQKVQKARKKQVNRVVHTSMVVEARGVVATTSRGRAIQRPQRLNL